MNQENFDVYTDISSSSVPKKAKKTGVTDYTEKYGNGIFKNLGTIIKFIAFIICFTIIGASFVVAYFLFSFDKFFMAVSAGIVVVGTVFAVIILFLIYGMGQIICQNNEILSRLKKLSADISDGE